MKARIRSKFTKTSANGLFHMSTRMLIHGHGLGDWRWDASGYRTPDVDCGTELKRFRSRSIAELR